MHESANLTTVREIKKRILINRIHPAIFALLIFSACSKDAIEPGLQDKLSADSKTAQVSNLIETAPANFFTNLFNTTGGGWTGGDGAYSIPLPDGRVLWTFGDSFLGTVNPDHSRPGTPMLNNTFVVQHTDGSTTTLHGGTAQNPEAYVKPNNPNHWYWPGDGRVIGNKLYLYMLRMRNSGVGGVWSFEHIGTDMAVFSLPNLQLIDQYDVLRNKDYQMGVHTFEDDGYIYVYGTRRVFVLQAVVARFQKSSPDQIEHWNGSAWGPDFVGNAYMLRNNGEALGVSNQFTVFKHDGKYRLLTQNDFFSTQIFLYTGDSPVGPWRNPVLVYETPETGGNMFTYNAFAHPHIQHPNKGMLVTYAVNSQNFWDIFADARIYRPRFFWLNTANEGVQ